MSKFSIDNRWIRKTINEKWLYAHSYAIKHFQDSCSFKGVYFHTIKNYEDLTKIKYTSLDEVHVIIKSKSGDTFSAQIKGGYFAHQGKYSNIQTYFLYSIYRFDETKNGYGYFPESLFRRYISNSKKDVSDYMKAVINHVFKHEGEFDPIRVVVLNKREIRLERNRVEALKKKRIIDKSIMNPNILNTYYDSLFLSYMNGKFPIFAINSKENKKILYFLKKHWGDKEKLFDSFMELASKRGSLWDMRDIVSFYKELQHDFVNISHAYDCLFKKLNTLDLIDYQKSAFFYNLYKSMNISDFIEVLDTKALNPTSLRGLSILTKIFIENKELELV